MAYYKFMDSSDLDKVLSGSLVFSKLSYFRIMEAYSKKAGIGDIGEGYYENYVTYADIKDTDRDTETLRRLRKIGIRVHGANVRFSNISTMGYDECYIFSLSEGVFQKLKAAMCSEGTMINYSAAVKLKNLGELSETIMKDGLFRSFYDETEPLRKISDHFSKLEKGRVIYKLPRSEINDVDFGVVEARFIKNPVFRSQSEFRFALTPCPDSFPDRISVFIPNAHRFISKVWFESQCSNSKITYAQCDAFELAERINSINVANVREDDLVALSKIVDEAILICWEARKLGHRNHIAEHLLLERDVVYGKDLSLSRINNIVSELTKSLTIFARTQHDTVVTC